MSILGRQGCQTSTNLCVIDMAADNPASSGPLKRSRSTLEERDEPTSTEVDDNRKLWTEQSSYVELMPEYLDTSSEDDIGPALPSSVPKKKRRKLPYEKLYISALPSSARYSKSLMHKDQLSFVTMTPFTDFLITSSIDGVVKFWKKDAVGIEFVKEFKAHTGEIKSVSVSQDGRSFATAGIDKTVKIFDVITFGIQ